VGGEAEKMSAAEAARYFLTRPRESQLVAWASAQSRPLSVRRGDLEWTVERLAP